MRRVGGDGDESVAGSIPIRGRWEVLLLSYPKPSEGTSKGLLGEI